MKRVFQRLSETLFSRFLLSETPTWQHKGINSRRLLFNTFKIEAVELVLNYNFHQEIKHGIQVNLLSFFKNNPSPFCQVLLTY